MWIKKQKKLSSFMVAGGEANHHYPGYREGSEGCLDRVKRCIQNWPLRADISRAIVFSLLFVLFFACPLWATTYYVKNGGNDSLAGTSDATAWATITKVNAAVKSGDIVYFQNAGIWVGVPPILTAKTGVTYDGSSWGTGTRAILSATSNPSNPFKSGVVRVDVSDVTIKGFEIDGNDYSTYGIDACSYYIPASFSNLIIKDCDIHNAKTRGIYIGSQTGNITVSNVLISNNTVRDITGSGIVIYPQWGGQKDKVNTCLVRMNTVYNCTVEGIYVKDDADNVTIEYNSIFNNSHGIHLEESEYAGDQWIDNFTARYNIIFGNVNAGIDFVPRGYIIDADIYSNLIYNNGIGGTFYGFGIHIPAADYGGSKINIYNNTIAQISMSSVDWTRGQAISVGLYGSNAMPKNLTLSFYNNIVYAHQTPYQAIYVNCEDLKSANNLIYSDSIPHLGEETIRIMSTTYSNNEGIIWDASSKYTKPNFVGGTLPTRFMETYGGFIIPETDYFAITSGDALSNGITLGSPYDGCINWTGGSGIACRPEGAYDIGAYELITTTNVVPRPKVIKLSKIN